MKKRNFAFVKKLMPANSRRINKPDGTRVWEINGREVVSKRAYFEALQARAAEVQRIAEEALDQKRAEFETVAVADGLLEDIIED